MPRQETKPRKPAREERRLQLLARIRIEQDIESLNKILRRTYKGGTNKREVDRWGGILRGVQLEQLGADWIERIQVESPHSCRRIEIIRRCKRLLDDDNFQGGCKPIMDALKSTTTRVGGAVVRLPGWFYDDSMKYVDRHAVQIITGEAPWLEISLFGKLEKTDA